MKGRLGTAALTFFLVLAMAGCGKGSTPLDYIEIHGEEVLDADCTLGRLQKALKKDFDDVKYVEGKTLSAGPYKFFLEEKDGRITITKTVGAGTFGTLMTFGRMEEVEHPSGIKINEWVVDEDGAYLLDTKLVIDYYVNK